MKKSLLLVIGIPLLIFVGLRKNSAPFFSVKAHRCIHDEILSDDYCASISAALTGLLDEHCAAPLVIAQLKKQFPVLKKIIISYGPSVTRITISAYEPVCCINNSVILTAQDQLFSKNMFSSEALIGIAEVEVAHASMAQAPTLVSCLLRELPYNIDNVYNLELINEHCVYFVNKEQPNFTIVSSLAQKKSSQLLARCESVKQSIDDRKGFDKGIKWIADTRFAHYIVAYKA